MSFAKFTCWDRDRVYAVLEHNAESMDPRVFLAVHSEHDLVLVHPDPGAQRSWREQPRQQVAPRDFLRDFLNPGRRHVQAAVVGGSGSGKSHLIRWMDLNIERTPERVVLTLPKLGTSLRKVLEMLIAELPPDRKGVYRERLDRAGYELLTPEQRRERLLSRIADAIAEDKVGERGSEEEQWLIAGEGPDSRGLPDLFLDPVYRQHVGKSEGTIDRLVRHIGDPNVVYEHLEQARELSVDDLPLDPHDIMSMSKPAKELLRQMDDELRAVAIKIVNRNLDAAIAQVLNFRADDLVNMMLEIRRHLLQQGKELILLIEDYASIQGIDRPLVDALNKESSPKDPLCPMRWMMALTHGFYETKLPDTLHTRMAFLVDMDLPTGGRAGGLDDDAVASFAARYLNAVRLDPATLDDWYRDGQDAPVPNACDSCQHREVCLPAFDEADDRIGLYPFNRASILEMARRQNPQFEDRFSPRSLMTNVIAAILDNYHDDIKTGRFPDRTLLDRMGPSDLDPLDRAELRQNDPINFERQLAVLSLWGDPKHLTPLPADLYRAFSLTAPVIDPSRVRERRDDDDSGSRPTLAAQDRIVTAIRAWGQGERMPEMIASTLRDIVYDALMSYIDWDAIGLHRSTFTGPLATFARRNVYFHRQEQAIPKVGVVLGIPLADDPDGRTGTSIALEGLYLFRQHRSWNFPRGQQSFLWVGEELNRWSSVVVDQLLALPVPRTVWDPAVAAVEVLAVGAALANRPVGQSATLVDRVNSLFEPWPDRPAAESREWRALYDVIRRRQTNIVKLLRAHASGMKGSAMRAFVDPSQIVPPFTRIRRTWQPAAVAPPGLADRRDEWGQLAKLHTQVFTDLTVAAQAEHARRIEWLASVRTHMAAEPGRAEVVTAVEAAIEAATNAGLGHDRSARNAYQDALPAFQNAQIVNAIRLAEGVERVAPLRALAALARTHDNAVEAAREYLPAAERVLDQLAVAVANKREQLTSGAAGDAEQLQQKIGDDLARLLSVLDEIGGEQC